MSTLTTHDILIVHSCIVGLVWILCAVLLMRRNLFYWASAGFWAWLAFGLYFVMNPLMSALSDSTVYYEIALYVAGGMGRAVRIGAAIILAMLLFTLIYRRVPAGRMSWKLGIQDEITIPMWLVILICFAIGLFSTTYRLGIAPTAGLTIEEGRFVGQVTGYEYVGHHLMVVPILLLCLSRHKFWQVIGWLLAIAYMGVGILDPSARYRVVSMAIALSLVTVVRRRARWPSPVLIFAVAALAVVLQVRGHERLNSLDDVLAVMRTVPESAGQSFYSVDSAMLSTFYVESYTRDTLSTYDYGIPLVNYVTLGYLPIRFFPWKYFLVDWLRAQQTMRYDSVIVALLRGAKSSLLGSFYANGGFVGVALFSVIAAYLSAKLDAMLRQDSPQLLQATGIAWMSALWMVWGSSDYWGVSTFGVLAMPTLMLWLVAPKEFGKRPSVQPSIGETTTVGS